MSLKISIYCMVVHPVFPFLRYMIINIRSCMSRLEELNFTLKDLLKVPKREIFDRSDFHDFYTIKSLRVGDFGVKITKFFTNI